MGNFTRELDGTLQGVAASVRAEAGEHLAGAEGRRTHRSEVLLFSFS